MRDCWGEAGGRGGGGGVCLGLSPPPSLSSSMTDAAADAAGNGVPAVVAGPGDVADAHQPDESIAIDQLEQCTDFLVRLADTCR